MFTSIRSHEVYLIIHRLQKACDADDSGMVDMKSAIIELTLNIMMKMIAGKSYYGDDIHNLKEAKRLRESLEEIRQVTAECNAILHNLMSRSWYQQVVVRQLEQWNGHSLFC